MLRAIQEKIEYKILLLLTLVLILGFGTYVIATIQAESQALLEKQQTTLRVYSETVSAGIRTVMLTGKSTFAVSFLNDVRDSLSYGDLTIFDRFGREVFLREGEGVLYDVNDPLVTHVLETRSMQSTMVETGTGTVYSRYEPLENRQECWRCHDPKETIRGVLQLALNPEPIRTTRISESTRALAAVLGDWIAVAFRTIMLGGQGEMMDTLTSTVDNIPGVRRVQVYANEGYVAFGPEEEEMDEETVIEMITGSGTEKHFEQRGSTLRMSFPLVNEERCQVCHGSGKPMRGLMVIDYNTDVLRPIVSDPSGRQLTSILQSTVFEGFRSIMLVGRATSTRYYMDELRKMPAVHTLRVFDREGNERFLNPPPRTRPELARVVREQRPLEITESILGEERLVRLTPLLNENRCFPCHGRAHEIRGVVEVSASLRDIGEAIRSNTIRSAAAGTITILLVWGVIRLFMRSVVVRPVQMIERFANRVGLGDLSARADVSSRDEIGNLAARMNEMVQGLRERFHLQKFVSRQTVEAVRLADSMGVKLGGERKVATVLFSDIRGFTAFSEQTDPETVVEVLNSCLSQQEAIVRKHKGDIDKFVGDELVAVFEGPGMVENAVRAALEIQETTQCAPGGSPGIAVGVGINTGEMVMGAMGSADRMDYTVIGDNVNLGARLCSAAAPGTILISGAAVRSMGPTTECEFVPLDPLTVKGKQAPVEVFAVRRNSVERTSPPAR